MNGKLKEDHTVSYLNGRSTTTKLAIDLTPMTAVRAKCMDCAGGSCAEVRECVLVDCPLFPYRMGHRPVFEGRERLKKKLTDEQLAKMQEARKRHIDSDASALSGRKKNQPQAVQGDI